MKKTKGTLVIILAVPPIETLIQLLDSILKSDHRLSILVHLSNQYNISDTVTEVTNKLNSNRLHFIPKSIPTSWGRITNALLQTMCYAKNNFDFEYLVFLPFNCLPIRKDVSQYLENKKLDIFIKPIFKVYDDKNIMNDEITPWNSGHYFQQSKISKFILRKMYNGSHYWGGFFEGFAIHRKVINHFEPFKFWVAMLSDKVSLIYEEIFFHTILMEVSKKHNYQLIQDQLCFYDWDKSHWVFNPSLNKYEHKIETGNVERINQVLEQNQSAFFYKWVSTDVNDSNRKELINFINN